jgi:hypothetical protein
LQMAKRGLNGSRTCSRNCSYFEPGRPCFGRQSGRQLIGAKGGIGTDLKIVPLEAAPRDVLAPVGIEMW